MYKFLIKPLLFLLPPETAHHLTFFLLRIICSSIPGRKLLKVLFNFRHESLKKKVMGIEFPNPVGLAAGLDKDGRWIQELDTLGFGFIEIGTITPLGQPGNEKPRLFRLKEDKALINRMGFNNYGAEAAAKRLRKKPPGVIVGGNIGKNKTTPNEDALKDYIFCMDALYGLVDYFVVNVSSPNTPGLRELQEKGPLRDLLSGLKKHLAAKPRKYPMLLKVSPDVTLDQIEDIAEIVTELKIDGIIATNTTIERDNLISHPDLHKQIGQGGLSGKPLKPKSTGILKAFRQKLGSEFSLIGTGGILSPEDVKEKLDAGADLVQVYTGLIYEGPELPGRINKWLVRMN